jgi:TolB protein
MNRWRCWFTAPPLLLLGGMLWAQNLPLLTVESASPSNSPSSVASPLIGIFTGQSDVGNPAIEGDASFDPATKSYRVSGAGANIWGRSDEFHFVWIKLSGDISLTATLHFVGAGTEPHRKMGLMIRKTLDPGSPYVDAVVHGSGLMALQVRAEDGGITEGFQAPGQAPDCIRLDRKGNLYSFWQGKEGGPLQPVGAIRLNMGREPVYVGLFISSHNAHVKETGVFSSVGLNNAPASFPAPQGTR